MGTKYLGTEGEMVAMDYLAGLGGKIIDKNVRLAGAEIDIIAQVEGVLAFIEVKRRASARYGRPAEAVNFSKMRKIVRAASLYLATHGLEDVAVRFDVIELLPGELNHIRAAFDASDMW